ncbi:phosphatidylglycerol:prolipoprotein diacylglycerol transferase [Aequitasia blattaphilus]|uniref:Phosphatidylglycerol--prolipoprotein diacylglyceryl transferase n=1 Tax=Aequitasia blattaphilus TaxID=2949332 RepID=A0ABT1EA84_9FIRM|nr:prolipoprotein diacylglyceryl transferase [Aequitasia blattaphilus]MCP1102748.1 prolipoprotein diacylglyceryl transferase [Aequitasia blattaphilus]MCR8615388.1 prolipoprotein diacylglyceryl transferase [Aequitasia blattaphilus]
MNKRIDFPNLGIHLKNVGMNFDVFGFEIAYYGILIGLGVLAGVAIAMQMAKKSKQNPETYLDLAIVGVITSVIGARLFYVAFSWEEYKDDLLSILNVRQGGLAIYGGIIAAIIVAFLFGRKKKISVFLLLDTVSVGLVTGQMIGRWGNFFNREVFGEYTNNIFAMRLPLSEVRASDVSEKMRQHMETVDGAQYIQVHPTFLYESLWCLGLLIILLIFYKHKKFNGEVFLVYMLGYGIGRFWIEGIRTDQLFITGTQIPVSQMLAAVFALVALVLIIIKRIQITKRGIDSKL